MEERGGKTIMCSVLFLDIVEYSRRSVSGQISLKDRFNKYLSAAISHMPIEDRIILDTGDGAAINFLGDVEDALKAALSMRDSILNEGPDEDPPLLVRAGINLGPVRLVRDINGQPNIVGDGINVAQRIMGFAEPDQILVSRSYFDAVSNLSPQYAGMFKYQGSRTDKHVRDHEIYSIGHLGEKTAELIATNLHEIQRVTIGERLAAFAGNAWRAFNDAAGKLKERFVQAPPKQRVLYASAAALPVVLLGALMLKLTMIESGTSLLPDAELMVAESGVEPASGVATEAASGVAAEAASDVATKAASAVPVAASAVVPAKPASTQTAVKPDVKKIAKPDAVKSALPDTKKSAETASDAKKSTEVGKHDNAPAAHDGHADTSSDSTTEKKTLLELVKGGIEPGTEAYLSLRCPEGTQLFVDGKDMGKATASGLTVAVTPGKHKLIVTSKKGQLHAQDVELVSGKTVKIKPPFCE